MAVEVPARSRIVVWAAAAGDTLAVVVFAAIGRRSHQEGLAVLGVLEVAAPFLLGALVGWLAGRVWRAPLGPRNGVVVWLAASVVGLIVRATFTHRLPPTFALIATVSLAILILGWRAVGFAAARTRRATA
ncbi:MAG TPA: DUF3054 domain-containing protein [Pseudonocardia sp.]|nr:DUF3054 domain-containing protein [Pseudonocardia sp.]